MNRPSALAYLDVVRRLAERSIGHRRAKRDSSCYTSWDVSGNCESPVYRELWARPDAPGDGRYITIDESSGVPMGVRLFVRCRLCGKCMRERATLWRHRALHEVRVWERTWFGSLTLRPSEQYKAYLQACKRMRDNGLDMDALPVDEQFEERHRQISRALTLFLKRVRKESGAPLRYLCVAEAHESGLPHYHMLVHEVDPSQPIRKRVLKGQWGLGHSDWKLVGEEQAGYVCKYLSKSSAARVRASQNYGSVEQQPASRP